MSPSQKKRILILTAGFGEGHNSAANNLKAALDQHCESKVVDPCEEGAPIISNILQSGYRYITTRHPKIWKHIYASTERRDFSKQTFPPLRNAEYWLKKEIAHYQPDTIVSTYPLYPYFMERINAGLQTKLPIYTIVTDSININSAWTKAPTDHFIVADAITKQSLISQGVPESKIKELGFPTHPRFSHLEKLTSSSPTDPFRVLYFPTAKKPHVRRVMRAVLEAGSLRTQITVVLGKNLRSLYSRAHEIKKLYPERVKLKGWSRHVPELLCNHHLVIGKAGGATAHEAIAACCPMFVNHLVPGQEEGNLALLQHIGGGELIEDEKQFPKRIHELLSDEAAAWKNMKDSMHKASRATASEDISRYILQQPA